MLSRLFFLLFYHCVEASDSVGFKTCHRAAPVEYEYHLGRMIYLVCSCCFNVYLFHGFFLRLLIQIWVFLSSVCILAYGEIKMVA